MKKKNFDGGHFISSDVHEIIRVYGYVAQIKALYRQGWIGKWGMDTSKAESVGDHIFAGCLLTFLIAREYAPSIDAEHALKIFLFHDLGEAIVGDYTPYDDISTEQKDASESKALEEIFHDLRNAREYIGYWEEYRDQKTKEAQFVKIIDKLEAIMMAYLYEAQGEPIDLSQWDAYFKKFGPTGEVKDIFLALQKL